MSVLEKVKELREITGAGMQDCKNALKENGNDIEKSIDYLRKKGVLKRWYKAVTPLLKHYYGTGGDLNVDEIQEVIPITEDCGVWHPQEGVFNGHFQPRESQKINRI